MENTPGFPEGKPVHKTQQMFSENFGQKIMFDASEDMVFESDTSNDRKSVEFCKQKNINKSVCNNSNINKSGKRQIKTPNPHQSFEPADDDLVLNKSVEIQKRSRNKHQRLSMPSKMTQNKSTSIVNKKESYTSQPKKSQFFKTYNTQNNSKRYGQQEEPKHVKIMPVRKSIVSDRSEK